MLQTGVIICLFKSVGSKRTLRLPFGFFTMTKLFNYSDVDISGVTSVSIPALTIESISCLNLSHKAKGTFLAGFLIGVDPSCISMEMGLHLKQPMP